jgi:hypothetical protein
MVKPKVEAEGEGQAAEPLTYPIYPSYPMMFNGSIKRDSGYRR